MEGNSYWRGGRTVQDGSSGIKYVMVRCPGHPNAVRGYVMEHRLVVEKKLGRYLTAKEVVHHIDHDTFNNAPENLEVMSNSSHIAMHNRERKKRRGVR